MLDEKYVDSTNILEDIDSLDDFIERLYDSNEIVYDEKFHKDVVRRYRELMVKINNSNLSTEDKAFTIEMIAQSFVEHKK